MPDSTSAREPSAAPSAAAGPLHILHVEDDPDDVYLVRASLEEAGVRPVVEHVDKPEQLRAALREGRWDVVLADLRVPRLDAFRTLELLQESGRDVPLIVVSGSVGEEYAAELMRAGAGDYVLKNNLTRLVPAIQREVRQAALRRERREADEAARRANERVANILETITDAFYALDHAWCFTYVNRQCELYYGMGRERMLGRNIWEVFPRMIGTDFEREYRRAVREQRAALFETLSVHTGRWVEVHAYPSGEGLSVYFQDITARRETDEALRESEERLSRLIETVAEGIVTYDPEGRITYLNPEAERISGVTLAEGRGVAVGSGAWRLSRPDGAPLDREEYPVVRVLRTGHPVRGVEVAFAHADGTRRIASVNVVPVYGARGTLVSVVGSLTDITARKEQEIARLELIARERAARQEAETAEQRTRFLSEASALLASSLDYNLTLQRVAGLLVPELADWCSVDVLDERGTLAPVHLAHVDPEKVRWAREIREKYPIDMNAPYGLPNVIRTGKSEFYPDIPDELLTTVAKDEEELALLRKIGYKSILIVPLQSRGQALGGIQLVWSDTDRRYTEADLRFAEELAQRAAVAIDNSRLYRAAQEEVAERQRAERELRDSRDQLRAVLQGVTDAVTAQNADGRLVYANDAAARVMGFRNVEELLAAPLEEAIARFEILAESGEPFPLDQLPGSRVLRGEPAEPVVLRYRVLATGEERWSVVTATPVTDEEGRVRLAINIAHDLTERLRQQHALQQRAEELERSNRDLEQFAYIASHDLREPLRTISTYAQLIARQLEDVPDETREMLRVVRESARRLDQLILDLLAYSRLGSVSRPFPKVSAGAALDRALAGLQAALDECGAVVTHRALPTVRADASQLTQLFQNLVGNAIKFRAEGRTPRVTVQAERRDDEWVFSVSDNGIGFAQKYHDRIFQIFQRLHTREQYDGTGVGLAVVKRIVEHHGGRIWVESEPGRGSTFHFSLPA